MARKNLIGTENASTFRGKVNDNFEELYAKIPYFYGWGYQDFDAGSITTTSVTITENTNGTGFIFDSERIINNTAVIVRASNHNKIPYTWTIANFLQKVSTSGNTASAVTLSGVPHITWGGCRIYYMYTYEAMPTGYTIAPKFVSGQVVDALDESFINEEEIANYLKLDQTVPQTTTGTFTFPTVTADTLKSSTLITNYIPYYSGGLKNSGVYWDAVNGRMGIGTATPTAGLELGSISSGKNQTINATEGIEMAPILESANWTVSSGAGWTAGSGQLVKTETGTPNIITPLGTFNVVAGRIYKVVITVSAVSGTLYSKIGGAAVHEPMSKPGTYTDYTIAQTGARLEIGSTGTATITSVSVKEMTEGTGVFTNYGKTRVTGLWSVDGVNVINFTSQGNMGIGGAALNSGYRLAVYGGHILADNGVATPYLVNYGTNTYIYLNESLNTLSQRSGSSQQIFRLYNTYTNSSNYERLSITGVQGQSVNINAETAGTGADNLNIVLTPSGSGNTILNGNVGIGTTAPAEKLEVNGNIRVSNLTASQLLASDANKNIVSLSTANYPSLQELGYLKGVTDSVQDQINNTASKWTTVADGIHYTTTDKNVGVGIIAPTAKLHVVGTDAAANSSVTGVAATNIFTMVGGAGGNTSNNDAVATGGRGANYSLIAGKGGTITGTPTIGSGGAGGYVDIYGGDGGVGTTFGGVGGYVSLQGGTGGWGTNPGFPGYVTLKGGNAFSTGNQNGGDIFLVGGIPNGTGVSGNIMLGVSPSNAVRGNVGVNTAVPTAKVSVMEKTGINEFGGFMIKLTNKTGAASVKGTVVYADPDVDNAFEVNPINGDMPIGIVYQDGVADGGECWIVISGIAEVLLVDSVDTTRSYVAYASGTTAGRIDTASTVPAAATHFREVGHTLESKIAGTNVLVRCVIHFN